MTTDNYLTELIDALQIRRVTVERKGHIFDVKKGTGIMAHESTFDAGPLLEELKDHQLPRRRQIAAFASGVHHVLLEPSRSQASQWDFVESTGGLIPGIHAPGFEQGVEAAAGESAWTVDFFGDLRIAYFIKLDRGMRVLTKPQVERWGVSDDRITSAARSILFHNTRNLDFQTFDDGAYVKQLRSGDGHDATRCLVVGDAFFGDIDAGFRFTMPSPDHFLAVMDATAESTEELRQTTESTYQDVDYPLSTQVFRFETGKPVPDEELT